jgi:hypothetical protein
MAKETKKAATEVATTEDNVMEQIKSGNMLKESNVQAAIAEIEKQKDEKQKKDAMDMICVAKYNNIKALLELRARRREEKATKAYLSETKKVLDDALAGKITPTDYKKKRSELKETCRKEQRDSNRILDEELTELQNSFEGRYSYWWD